jgi:hypothetical protein
MTKPPFSQRRSILEVDHLAEVDRFERRSDERAWSDDALKVRDDALDVINKLISKYSRLLTEVTDELQELTLRVAKAEALLSGTNQTVNAFMKNPVVREHISKNIPIQQNGYVTTHTANETYTREVD